MTTAPYTPKPPAAPLRTSRHPAEPGPRETVLAFLTQFFLLMSVPTTWFRQGVFDGVQPGSDLATQAIFVGLFGFATLQLISNLPIVIAVARSVAPVTLFVGLALLSTLWTSDVLLTLQDSIILALTTVFGLYLVVRFSPRQIVGMVVVVCGLSVVVNLLWSLALPSGVTPQGQWTGAMGDKNTLGRASVFCFGHLILGARMFPRFRAIAWLLSLAAASLVLGSQSTTSFASALALAGLLAVFVAFRSRRELFGAAVVGMVAAVGFSVSVLYVNLPFVADLLGKDATLTGRTRLWELLVDDIWQRPLLGYGYHGFFTGWFGPVHSTWIEFGGALPHAHNALLTYLIELGVVGAALMLWAIFRLVSGGVAFVQREPTAGGLWPLMTASFVVMFGVTEVGVHGRTLYWTVFLIALSMVERDRLVKRWSSG